MIQPTKPAVVLWIHPEQVLKMSQGTKPVSWYTEPHKDCVQIIVPCDFFTVLYEDKLELNSLTEDLPF